SSSFLFLSWQPWSMARYLFHHTLPGYFQSNARVRLGAVLALFATIFLFIATFKTGLPSLDLQNPNHAAMFETAETIIGSSRRYIEAPLPSSAFGEMGNRTAMLTRWMEEAVNLRPSLSNKESALLTAQLEDAVVSMYPFLKNPTNPEDPLPFTTL